MAFRIARAIAVCLCLLGGTAAAAGASDWDAWVKSVGGGHALAGKVVAVAADGLTELRSDGTLPAPPEGLVLLGEMHDNPHHHRVRAWLIAGHPVDPAQPAHWVAALTMALQAMTLELPGRAQVLEASPEDYRALKEGSLRLIGAHDIQRTISTFENLYRGKPVTDPVTDVAPVAVPE